MNVGTMHQAKANLNIADMRKKLIFRSWHRGTREIDLILGRFADAHVPDFDEALLHQYDALLQNPDPDLYDWIIGRADVPAGEDSEALRLLIAFTSGTAA